MYTTKQIIAVYANADMELSHSQAEEVLSRVYPLYGGETESESLDKVIAEDAFERGCLAKEAEQTAWNEI
jgi:hypothetical protein